MSLYASEEWLNFGVGHPGGTESTARLLAKSGASGTFLDVGCGAGWTVEWLTKMGYIAVGVDVSEVVEAARNRFNAEFLCANAESLPFGDKSFNGVFLECVLSTNPNKEGIIKEAARVSNVIMVSDIYLPGSDKSGQMLSETEWQELFSGFKTVYWADATEDLNRFRTHWVWTTGKRFPLACSSCAGYFNAVFEKEAFT